MNAQDEELLNNYDPLPAYLVTGEVPEPEEPTGLTILSSANRRPLTTKYLQNTYILPQYPRTHPEGFTYCLNTTGRDPNHGQITEHDLVTQYGKAKKHPPKKTKCPYLGNISATRYRWQCSGIKACHFMPRALATKSHTNVDDAWWAWMLQNRPQFDMTEPNELRQNAIAHARALQTRFLERRICSPMSPTCRITWHKQQYEDIDGTFAYFASCVNYSRSSHENHFFKPFSPGHQIDLELLGELITGLGSEVENEGTTCSIHESVGTRLKNCTALHSSAPGALIIIPCEVEFNAVIPDQSPYVLWTSHGIHSHLPPPPTRAPTDIVRDLQAIVNRATDTSTTRASFLRSGFLRSYLATKNIESIGDLHLSFIKKDRIRAMISLAKLTLFPEGPQFAGVQFEFEQQLQEPDKQYIQGIWDDDQGPMIICFLQAQARHFIQRESFQVDMSFKRIRERDMNEVTFAGLLRDEGTIITFARAYIQGEDAAVHQLLFERLFNLLDQKTNCQVKWHHLHSGEGFQAVIMDMGPGQLKGLGLYLSSIDPARHDWSWHIERILICCRIHLRRSIEQILGPSFSSSGPGGHMMAIMTAQSEASYYDILREIRNTYGAEYEGWCLHKSYTPIAAGLNAACSRIPAHIRSRITNHTNAVEQTHQKSYSMGKKQNLLPAIQSARTLDQHDVDQYANFHIYGVRNEDRTANIVSRIRRDLGREARKRQLDINRRQAVDSELFDNLHPNGRLQRQSSARTARSQRSSSTRSERSRTATRSSSASTTSRAASAGTRVTPSMPPPELTERQRNETLWRSVEIDQTRIVETEAEAEERRRLERRMIEIEKRQVEFELEGLKERQRRRLNNSSIE